MLRREEGGEMEAEKKEGRVNSCWKERKAWEMKAEKKGRLVKWRLRREEIGEMKAEREVGWGNGC